MQQQHTARLGHRTSLMGCGRSVDQEKQSACDQENEEQRLPRPVRFRKICNGHAATSPLGPRAIKELQVNKAHQRGPLSIGAMSFATFPLGTLSRPAARQRHSSNTSACARQLSGTIGPSALAILVGEIVAALESAARWRNAGARSG